MSKRYKRSESVVTREIAGETMLIPVTSHLAELQQIFALDPVSALIWSLLDGTHGLDDMVATVTRDFAVSEAEATADTERFLNELGEAGLVEQT